ncbi:MAG: hypothetical protein GYB53_10345 [Rhodobacteraceae bacterium]|nr:hypothetical protein [Paracoccaceae bacterium]MBR9820285.1 hypothetical protein [Paracoccaceae bacterium]
MDVILHIGAHRTATTSFQGYLRANAPALAGLGVGFWGPRRTRGGVLAGVIPGPGPLSPARQFDRARGRIALNLAKAGDRRVRQLLVSDENILGSPRGNLRRERLYPDAGPRVAAFARAFEGQLGRIVISVRGQESYWTSVLCFALARGHALPHPATLDRLVTQPRGWREVIEDLAEAAPGVEILVMPHERYAGLPERRLARMLGDAPDLPQAHARHWLNRSPDLAALRNLLAERGEGGLPAGPGPWRPFDHAQRAALNELYQDDMFWLSAGASGLARLAPDPWEEGVEEASPTGPNGGQPAAIDPRARLRRRGQGDDDEEGRMVRTR